AGDRGRATGSVVPGSRREGQGGHARWSLSRPDVELSAEQHAPDGGERRGPIGRRAALKRAVEILYEAGLREADAVKLLGDRVGAPEIEPISDYTISLVEGVCGHRARHHARLSEHAQEWRLRRMPAVGRAVLR